MLYRLWEPMVGLDVFVITFALGWFITNTWRTFRMKMFALTPISSVGLLAMAGTTWLWWLNMQDFRPFFILGVLAAIAIDRIKPPGFLAKKGHMPTVLATVVICTYGSFAALSQVPPFGMIWSNQDTATCPGGRYSANVLNVDGLAYGYDFLVLRPAKFEISTLFDRPHREVAEFVMEGDVTGLAWNSPTSLTVRIRPKTEFVTKKTSWSGIDIQYLEDKDEEPSESAN